MMGMLRIRGVIIILRVLRLHHMRMCWVMRMMVVLRIMGVMIILRVLRLQWVMRMKGW